MSCLNKTLVVLRSLLVPSAPPPHPPPPLSLSAIWFNQSCGDHTIFSVFGQHLASPQTSFGVRSSRIHCREMNAWRTNPRTSAGLSACRPLLFPLLHADKGNRRRLHAGNCGEASQHLDLVNPYERQMYLLVCGSLISRLFKNREATNVPVGLRVFDFVIV